MSSKTVLETLEAARKLITPRKNWIKHALAEDSRGADIGAWQPEACRWCSAGAILAVCGSWGNPTQTKAMDALEETIGGYVGVWNDTHTHAEVLRAFDAAIAKEREAQHVL